MAATSEASLVVERQSTASSSHPPPTTAAGFPRSRVLAGLRRRRQVRRERAELLFMTKKYKNPEIDSFGESVRNAVFREKKNLFYIFQGHWIEEFWQSH